MPDMDGLELAEAVRNLLPNTPKLVMVTASDTSTLEQDHRLKSFDTLLNKPITAAQIGKLLANREIRSPISEKPATAPLAGLRILLAEDIPTNQLIACEYSSRSVQRSKRPAMAKKPCIWSPIKAKPTTSC